MNKSFQSLAPLRFMIQTHTHAFNSYCSVALLFADFLSFSPCARSQSLPLSLSPSLIHLGCLQSDLYAFLENGMGFAFSFAHFCCCWLVICYFKVTLVVVYIQYETIQSKENDIFIFISYFFTLNSITRAKH